jgi:hypothetical protein
MSSTSPGTASRCASEQKVETGNRAPEFLAGKDDVRANVVAQACAVASGSRQVSLWLI